MSVKMQKVKTKRAGQRRRRVRGKIQGTADIPRLTVRRSLKNIYAQIIDDQKQQTLVGLSTLSHAVADKLEDKDTKTDQAKKLGQMMAELAVDKGIKKVVFDRNQYRYFGRVKAVAEGAREKGLEF